MNKIKFPLFAKLIDFKKNQMLFHILLLLQLILSVKTCENDLYCFICPYDSSDPYYLDAFKLSPNQKKILNKEDCLKKDTLLISRNIVILNQNICLECQTTNFDANYTSFAFALQEESRVANGYVTSTLNIYLQTGDHFVIEEDFLNPDEELFRRMMIDISIQKLSLNSSVSIYLKTTRFFMFVSKSLTLQNIDFYGNDMNLNKNQECSQDRKLCCSENDLMAGFISENYSCNTKPQNPENNELTHYGLFNLEYIFDVPNNSSFSPKILIDNCIFRNFYLINESEGFTVIISITSLLGNVQINNSILINSYFIQSFIYYSPTNYDLFAIIQNNLIKNQTFLDNIPKYCCQHFHK